MHAFMSLAHTREDSAEDPPTAQHMAHMAYLERFQDVWGVPNAVVYFGRVLNLGAIFASRVQCLPCASNAAHALQDVVKRHGAVGSICGGSGGLTSNT